MKATIYSNKETIGTTLLKVSDNSMGVLSGVFIPNENYKSIRHRIWEFNQETKDKDFEVIKSLRLNVQLDNGYFLLPLGGISIWDLEDLKDEPIELDVVGVFRHVIQDYFENTEETPILQEPWNFLTIGQKIAFENELKIEIGTDEKNGIFGFVKRKMENHNLKNIEVSALANTGMNDDVLFAIYDSKLDYDFVIVHLTWKRGKEKNPNWPIINYCKDFDEFKYKKMFPDKVEWES